MADKRTPTYDLEAFKSKFSTVSGLAVTGKALRSAAEIGYGRQEIVDTIQTMQRRHFYKSTTTYEDNRIWMDVYHVPTDDLVIYIKFVADTVTEFKLTSFKEK